MAIRLCSYNIEWFTHLFNTDNSLKSTQEAVERFTSIAKVHYRRSILI